VTPEATTEVSDGRALVRALWPVIPGMLLGALDATTVATALERISDDLGRLDIAAWVVTAYLLTASASAVPYGRLGDIYGRRKVLRVAVGIFMAGSLAAGLSQTMGELIAARVIMGAGGGGLVALALAALADSVPPRARGRYLGHIGAIFAGANLLGPILAGVLLEQFGWRAIFLLNIPIGVLGLAAGRVQRDAGAEAAEGRPSEKLDIGGSLLLACLVTCTLLLLRRVEVGLGSSGSTVAAAALAVTVLVLGLWFVGRQRRAAHPLLPLEMLTNRAFAFGIGGIFLASLVMFAALVYVPLYFQIVSPVSGIGAAFLLTPFTAGLLVGTMLPGRTIGRSGRYKRYPLVGSVLMLAGVLLLSTVGPGSVQQARVFLAVTGLGVGLTVQVLLLVVQNGVRYTDLGAATSATALVRAVGGATGIAAFSAVIGRSVLADVGKARSTGTTLAAGVAEGPGRLVERFTSGLHGAFLVVAPFAALLVVLAVRLREQPLRESVRGE